ncbi:MAG: T9SS type A sorting domain-containing protein [Saprospiraceae bacterium]
MTRTKRPFVPVAKLCMLITLLSITDQLNAQIEIGPASKCICTEGSPGKIELVSEGTAGPFTFVWDGPESFSSTDQNLENLYVPGLYSVTVTNAHACEVYLQIELESCEGINDIYLAPQSPHCNDPGSGSISLEVSGGAAPLSYAWSTGATTQNLSGLSIGTYSVTVTDNNGCTWSEALILAPAEPLDIVGFNVCEVNGEGLLEPEVTGGVPPLAFLWSTGASTEELVADAGTYSLTVTDIGGCSQTASYVIYNPPVVTGTVTPTPCEQAVGAISLSALPGQATPIVAWEWSDGNSSQNRTGLAAGNYCVTVTDANDCSFSDCFEVGSVNSLEVSEVIIDATNCDEPGNGSIALTASGGNPPYVFDWADGATGALRENLSAGNFQVTLSDQDECTLIQTYTVGSSASDLSLEATVIDDCENRGEGAILTTVTGGQLPYTYRWGFTGATSADLVGLTAGIYTLVVTDDLGCTQSAIYTVANHQLPDIQATLSPTFCGQSLGSISLTIANQPNPDPTAFQWADGAQGTSRTNLAAGTYTLTYTDPNGCQLVNNYEIIEENEAFTLTIAVSPSCATASSGSVDVAPSNGSAPYAFNWSDGAEGSFRANLAPGDYTVTVTDANSCTVVQSINIGILPALSLTPDIQPVSCGENGAGSISVTVGGGETPYTYAWSNNANTSSIDGLEAGDFTLTVTDAKGCAVVETYSTVSTEPEEEYPYIESVKVYAVSTSSAVDQVLIYDAQWLPSAWGCVFYTGGMLDISAQVWQEMQDGLRELKVVARANKELDYFILQFSQELGNIQRQESTGAIGTFTIFGNHFQNLVNGGELDETLMFFGGDLDTPPNTLLDLRSYSSNMTNCVSIPSLQADCNWSPPLNENWNPFDDVHRLYKGCMEVELTTSPSFNGIRYWATVTDGTYPYTKYVFTDPKGQIETFPGPFSPTLIANIPGRYCVEVYDAAGCISEACTDICPTEDDIAQMILDGAQFMPPCPGASNGSICLPELPEWPYKAIWLNGHGSSVCLENIPAGSYPVDIIEYRCGNTVRVFLTLGSQNDPIVISQTLAIAACPGTNDGRLCIQASGGGGAYTYLWDNGSTSNCIDELAAGQCYAITVSDACGNSASTCFELPAYQPMTWGTPSVTRACGTNNGAIAIQISGGKSPFTFEWENLGNGETIEFNTLSRSATLNDLYAGNYQVMVTDACGLQMLYPSSITVEPSADNIAINYQGAIINSACLDQFTGSIDVSMNSSPGTNYYYTWSTGATTQDVENLAAGDYAVTISGLGCEKTYYYTIPVIEFSLNETIEPICGGGSNGSITLNPTGNYDTPLSFLWENGATTSSIDGLSAGEYCVTVTSGNLCEKITCFDVPTLSNDLMINIESITGSVVGTPGQGNGAIDVSISGGLPPYTFSWSNGAQTEDIQYIDGGSYVLVVTDANGCQRSRQFDVPYCNPEGPEITAYPPNGVTPITGPGTGAINTSIYNGTPPFTYVWSGPGNFYDNKQDIENLSIPGTYCLTLTDLCGAVVYQCFNLVNDCNITQIALNPRNNCLDPNEGPSQLEFGGIALGGPAYIENDFSYIHLQWSNGETGLVRVERSNPSWFALAETIYGVSEVNIDHDRPGYYSVIVTMENGCQVKGGAYFNLGEFGLPTATVEHISSDDLLPGTDLDILVVNELNICETCGYVDYGTFINSQCLNSFDKRWSFNPDPNCTTGENICQNGGELVFEKFGAGPYLVPCNTTAIYLSEGNRCGCLFLPGTIPGLPPSFEGGGFREIEEYIYAPVCDPDANTDIDIVIGPGGPPIDDDYTLCYCDEPVSGQRPNLRVYKYDSELCEVIATKLVLNTDPLIESYRQAIDPCIYAPDLCDFCPIMPLVSNENELIKMEKASTLFKFGTNNPKIRFDSSLKEFSNIYPNPFTLALTIVINAPQNTSSQIKILNALGKTILNRKIALSAGETISELQIPLDIPDGIYYILIETEHGERAVHKIVRAK